MDVDTAHDTTWPPERMPGNSAPAGCLIATLFAALLPLFGFVLLFASMPSVSNRSGHLIWPFFQWAFVTMNGALAVSFIGGVALAPLFFLWLQRLIARFLSDASDVTDEQEFELPRHPSFEASPVAMQAARRWTILYGVTGGGVAALLTVLIGLFSIKVVEPALPPCAPVCVPSFFAATGILFLVPAIALWLALAAGFPWLLWLQHRCGIWLRKEPLVWRGLDYVRRPGVSAEAATTALARYRAIRLPQRRVSLAWGLVTVSLAVVWISLGQLLDAWLQLLWRP